MTIESVTNNGLTWINIQKTTREKMNVIGKRYKFHELNIEDSLSKIQIPKIDIYKDHFFMTLHFPIKEDKHKENNSPRISQLRRTILPLRRIILLVTRFVQKFSEEDLTLYYEDVNDHIDTVIEILEESKETIEIYKDTDFMLSTEKTNKIFGILTILFILSIPATVIGIIYRMNIELPGGIVETGSSHFF